MARVFFFVPIIFLTLHLSAQPVYISTSSTISFFAGTPVEDIDATNQKSISFLNRTTGEVTISIPNKEFHFKQTLMEEHFNENYMESERFPKSEFKGKINNTQQVDWETNAPQTLIVSGVLTIHGISKERTLTVVIHRNSQKIEADTKFTVPLSDHNIDRPKLLWEKLAENVEVHAFLTYEPYKK